MYLWEPEPPALHLSVRLLPQVAVCDLQSGPPRAAAAAVALHIAQTCVWPARAVPAGARCLPQQPVRAKFGNCNPKRNKLICTTICLQMHSHLLGSEGGTGLAGTSLARLPGCPHPWFTLGGWDPAPLSAVVALGGLVRARDRWAGLELGTLWPEQPPGTPLSTSCAMH